ncbi:MAG: aldo/keto reductase [Erysipelotrichaceae bacterium]|nr:aldo/keto reductase [Erysipelotrichaceae bacterium]
MSDYLGKDTPKLGFGMMRLPHLEDGSFDLEQIKKMVDLFLENGFTYFDTAFVYEGSEETVRKTLVERHPRDSYTLASKLHAMFASSEEVAKRELDISLERTGVGYFDYYLLHALDDKNYELYEKYHLWDFVKKAKEEGKIRHIGFSFHGTPELLDRLLKEHPEAEFVQLQLNYNDWESPSVQSRKNYETARRNGRPVVVMEPIRGGALANPIEQVRKLFDEADPDASYASWAIRYIASKEGILTVLSGMSTMEQMEDNVSYMKDFKPLDEKEEEVIRKVQEVLASIDSIPCTACHYCTGGCPMEIPIPDIFSARNRLLLLGTVDKARRDYNRATENKGKASMCIQCGQCESVCPQSINIIERLKECAETFE